MQTVTCQAPLSMGFPRQEYWNGLPFPSLGESSQFRDETKVAYLAGRFFTTEPHGESICVLLSPLFVFPSHLGHHRGLNRFPYGIQQVLISYLFYIQQCVYVNPNLPIHSICFPPWYPHIRFLHLCLHFEEQF